MHADLGDAILAILNSATDKLGQWIPKQGYPFGRRAQRHTSKYPTQGYQQLKCQGSGDLHAAVQTVGIKV